MTPDQENQRAIDDIVNAPRDRQGFLVNTAARRAIEAYAMERSQQILHFAGLAGAGCVGLSAV